MDALWEIIFNVPGKCVVSNECAYFTEDMMLDIDSFLGRWPNFSALPSCDPSVSPFPGLQVTVQHNVE